MGVFLAGETKAAASERHHAEVQGAVGEPGGAEAGEEPGDRADGAALVSAWAQPRDQRVGGAEEGELAEFHADVDREQAAHEAGGAVEWLGDFAGGKVGEFETEFAPGSGDADDGVFGDVDEAEDDPLSAMGPAAAVPSTGSLS